MYRIAVLLACTLAPVLVSAATVEDVLAKMDQAASSFQSMTANVRKVQHTAVIDDNSEESGPMMLKKQGAKGLAMKIDFTKPDQRTVAFSGKKAEIYYPKLKTVQEYNLSRYSDIVDQFMLVGFGTSGRELSSAYNIKIAGEETVAGQKAVRLALTPKTAARREKLKQLDLWLADGGAYPVQQKFLQPSGDYTTFTYSDVKLNAAVTDANLKLALPKGVKREYPQR